MNLRIYGQSCWYRIALCGSGTPVNSSFTVFINLDSILSVSQEENDNPLMKTKNYVTYCRHDFSGGNGSTVLLELLEVLHGDLKNKFRMALKRKMFFQLFFIKISV
jgi:hypothetical protein